MLRKWLCIYFGDVWEAKLKRWSWVILRVLIALLILRHGYHKLTHFSDISGNFPDPIGLGSQLSLGLVVASEFFGALFLLFGVFTRWASFSLFFTLFIAAFVVHGSDPFAKKELAVLYVVIFLFFTLAGGGYYSVDSYLKKKLK